MTVPHRPAASREIPEVAFAAPAGTPAPVEVLSLAALRERARGRPLQLMRQPQRPDFHHLLTVSAGSLEHMVDFTGYVLEPGAWLWVRPGQVHQWGDLDGAEGTVVFFERGFLDPATVVAAGADDAYAPAVRLPAGDDAEGLRVAIAHLEREFRALRQLPLEIHVAVLRHLLGVLVLRVAHVSVPGSAAPEPGETFLRFRDAVERDFTRSRRLDDYAHALGYSPRTLSRATLAGAGIGAKEFIDRRVILEAKRLLAHSDQSAARIADRLGFSSATNFSKFFHKRTGQTPIDFRGAMRGRGPRHP
ncbi:AraC family transcriptional regulator [Streptomyces sp. NBC_01381]|uniref:helix-turn-helix transcriptional regulator n=1 Tax=Streptomyces sp. NBC_01381 TaxID=2903845 RepID=UPI002258A1D3|nr:AraC family transcriptional regulator [Streptomyces sp. NBC_01381]MCX4669172.1 AraC family transcriptional regulator [Streptomyces sp. NBC_01381]